MEKELLQMCGYKQDEQSLALVNEIKGNYLCFNEVVDALKDLQPFLQHSDFYLSLRSGHHMIKIKNDLLDQDEFLNLDTEIVVWANEHNIELEEEPGQISILGRRAEE